MNFKKVILACSLIMAMAQAVESTAEKNQQAKKVEKQFDDFITRFDKNYETTEEYNMRLQLFIENGAILAARNAKKTSAHFDITKEQGADLTASEFKAMLLGLAPEADLGDPESSLETLAQTGSEAGSLDLSGISEVDWRSRNSGVKNQYGCGSCWAFAASSAAEANHAIRNKLTTAPRVSEQESLDCVSNAGCDGGGNPYSYFQWHSSKGMVAYETYPYTAVKSASCLNQSDRKKIMKVQAQLYRWFFSLNTLLDALKFEVVVVQINAGCQSGYSGGILSSADFDDPSDPYYSTGGYHCNAVDLNHAVAVVGIENVYDDTDGQWKLCLIIQNSWGTGHGVGGYEYVLIEDGPGFGGIFTGEMYQVTMEKLPTQYFSFQTDM